MATPSARDMLMQVQRYANGGTASAESSVGLARALANGTSQEQYYQNIREYVAKNPNPLAALNAASENGVSTADINSALGTKAASDYFTIDYNTETAPSANVATGFTSALAQRYNAPEGPGQSALDARIKAISQQYAANTPENAQILRDLFIKEGASIADVQRAGVDPSVLLGTVAKTVGPPPPPPPPKLPDIPRYTPQVVTPETQTQYPQPKPYTATRVYQPLPAPPPIYGAGQSALDVNFRNSAPRSEYGPYGYTYTPAASLLPATGAGTSWTPPSVTSRPRELLKVPLPTAANPQYSASQQFARDRAAAQLAALPGGRFSGMQAPEAPPVDPNAPVDPYGVKAEEFRFYAPKVAAKGGEIKKSEGSAQEELARFANGGPVATDRKPLAATDPLYIQTDTPAPRNPDAVARPTPMSHADLLAQIDRGTAASPNAVTPERDPVKNESAGMLARLNQAFYENVSKPAVGSAIDMTLGLGDLGQMGAKYLANRAGIKTDPFVSTAEPAKAAVGATGYNPYTIGGVAANLLPFARGKQAIGGAAKTFASMFPNLGREALAYSGGEAGAAVAREVLPDSTLAQVVAGGAGSIAAGRGGSPTVSSMAKAGDDVPPTDSARMLNELDNSGSPLAPQSDVPVVGGTGSVRPEITDELAALDETPAQPGTAAQMLDDLDQATTPEVRLSKAELGRVNASVGSNRSKQRLMKEEARRIKGNFLPTSGWERIEFSGVKKGKPEFQKIAYGFQKPPEGVDKQVWSNRLSDNIVSEVDSVVERAKAGDKAALGILRQANWYRGMRNQLRSEFGGIGDVFADVLGTTSAQTNVEQNFANASEILRRYSRGEFDGELQAYENRIKQGLPVDGKTLTALHNAGEFPLITSSSGKLFNTNSPSSMGALLDMFRSVKTGSAPKTPNFTGNLIGLTNEATVDVWAARMLRRLSGQSRIPPVAEQGVTGTHLVGSSLGNPRVGGEFGFGQEVFRNAANRINASGNVKSIVPEMGDLGPDDLQAVAWFMEKERWTDNGWTTKAGEGGSLEYEMSLAGSPEQVRINDLRREINTGFKAPNKRKKETDAEYADRVAQARSVYDNRQAFASIELQALQAPLQRYTIGISGERPGLPMSNYAQAELAAEVDDVVRNNPAVLGYNFANTYGSFMGNTERALNAELVVQQDFDPSALTRRAVEQGKFYDQDAVFISKAVPAGAPNARPGVEIFYKKAVSPADLDKITASLRAYGIDGFTYITDMRFNDKINRQTRSGDPETATLTGLRFQYIPEFDDAFDPTRAAEIYKEKQALFESVLADTMLDENVSDVRFNSYDTQVFFRDGYDEYLARTAPASGGKVGGELPTGAGPTQPNNGGRAGTELRQPVPDGLNQAPNRSGTQEGVASGGDFALGGYVTKKANGGDVFPVKSNASSSRRMLDDLIGKKPKGQRVDATGLLGFANGGDASSPMSNAELLAQMDRIGATPNAKTPNPDPVKTESQNMLQRFTSLNTPKDMSLGETVADIGMGFLPVVGTAQGARDFERARRDEDKLGMLLSAASMIPIAGGAVKAARAVGKASKAADDLAALTAKAPLDMSQEARMARAADEGYLPQTFYHASKQIIDEFKPGYDDGLIFLTPDATFANRWLGKGKLQTRLGDDSNYLMQKQDQEKIFQKAELRFGPRADWDEQTYENFFSDKDILDARQNIRNQYENAHSVIYPVRARVQNTFNPSEHESVVIDLLKSKGLDPQASTMRTGMTDLDYYKQGNYLLYESKEVVDFLKSKGFDSMWLRESTYDPNNSPITTLAIFDPTNIRSVNAAFDPAKRGSANLGYAQGGYITKKTKGAKP